MYCPNCKKVLDKEAVFCPDCGARTLPAKHCPICGQALEADMLYCPDCGTFIGGQAGANTPPYAQPPINPQPNDQIPYGQPASYAKHTKSYSPTFWLAAAVICIGVAALAISIVIFLKKEDTSYTHDDSPNQQSTEATKELPEMLPIETPAEIPTETPTKAPNETPRPTETEAPKTLEGMRTKEEQQSVLNPGTQLDLRHMGNLLGNTNASYSCYLLDITNMQEYMVANADTPMPASALIGIPILFTIADGVDNGSISLSTPALFTYTFENGRGGLKSADNGKSFPLSKLLSEALLYSDNNAMNSLLDYLTLEHINTTCHTYGFSSVDLQRKIGETTALENYISAQDAAMMLQAIYQNNFQGIGKEFLQTNFKISVLDTANCGMYPASSRCQTFLNLNGITDSRYNEVGLFENGEEVFILSIFTCNGVGKTAAAALAPVTTYALDTLQMHP